MLQDITLDNIHHAYLLVGDTKSTRGELSKWFLSHGVEIVGNPNFLEVGVSTFLIEHARELKHFLSEKNTNGGHTFVVIRTEYFSHPAQSALLKAVEEPGNNVTLFILVPRRHLILPTILSRVIEMHLRISDGVETVSELVASHFLEAKFVTRLGIVETFLKHHKDDEDGGQVKHEINQLLVDLEMIYAEDVKKNKKELEHIWFVKKYLHDQGSSAKILLEYLAVSL